MGMVLNLFSLVVVTVPSTPSPSREHQTGALTAPGPKRLFSLNVNLKTNDVRGQNTLIYTKDWPEASTL